ncbi:MAG: glycosyltransferase family 87 protein [Candidatus Limnocylindrales bacterium]
MAEQRVRLERALVRLGPALIVALFACTTLAVLSVAGSTLGYDAAAYLQAADRVLAGRPLYDPAVDVAVGYGVYLYPPPFALAAIPFEVLPAPLGLWAWLATMVAAFLAGTALLPVRANVRWSIVLLAALSFPFLYAVKLGQVGPLLYLAFAAGWRWIDRSGATGLAVAGGALAKLQPALLFGWMITTRRWRALAVGLGAVAVVAGITSAVAGTASWSDYLALLGRVNKPITTPQNLTVGAIAYRAGTTMEVATILQWAALAGVLVITCFAWLRRDGATGFVVGAVATQLLSPVIWSHYAMLLLLPVAMLLQRRQWWAVMIPLATWLPLDVAYPLVFAAALVGPVMTAPRARSVTPQPPVLFSAP